jgi:hypothetical protein
MSYSSTDTVSIAARCSVSGPLLRKVSRAACDSQRSKMLMRPQVEQIRGDREIETASCPASLFGDAHPAREVGLAPLRQNARWKRRKWTHSPERLSDGAKPT